MSVLTEKEDVKAVLRYAKSLPFTDAARVVLAGCSQGGFVSALTAAELGLESITALVLFYPALCIPDDARKGQMLAAHFDPQNIPDLIDCGPMKLGHCYPEVVMDMDAFQEIRKYIGPVLLIHGTADNVVDLCYSERAATAYQNARLVIIEGGAHGFVGQHDEEAIQAFVSFLRDC